MTNPTDGHPSELRRVITLLLVNLGLTALLAILCVIFRTSLVDYQIQRMGVPDTESVRSGLNVSVWSRVGVVAIIGVVYAILIPRLRLGRRRAYVRVLVLSVVSLAGIAYSLATAQYPVWVDVEQVGQAIVVAALLWAATRPAVRRHFAPTTGAPAADGGR
jgi:hypothetical protein